MLKTPTLFNQLFTTKHLFITLSLLACPLLGGCSTMNLSKLFQPVDTEKMSSYEQAKLNCSVVTGLESKADWTIFNSSGISLGLRLPSTSDALDDLNYDRKLDDYHDCLRLAGI